MKYSIVACAYDNPAQFKNFLFTAMNQNYKKEYEVIIVDNATPSSSIFDACYNYPVLDNRSLGYMRIDPSEKIASNITQGINTGTRCAVGENIVVVADSNVLLSFNILSKIDSMLQDNTIVTSTNCDIKLSPNGTKQSEYDSTENKAEINRIFLQKLGWPKDPMLFDLTLVPHRFPEPHATYDVYLFAIDRLLFIEEGGYDESQMEWGIYHHRLVERLCNKYLWKKLIGTRIVHQYHGIHKGIEAPIGTYSKQFEIMRCRRT